MKIKSHTWSLFAFAAVLGVVAAYGRRESATPVPAKPSFAGLDLAHDFGSVVEGTKIEHDFKLVNRFPVSISIVAEEDIQKTCGCTTLEPSTRQIAPGEAASIRMRVDTTGKGGRFRVGGVVRWQADGGDTWPVNLYMEGIAKTLLLTQPGLIQFSAMDISGQQTKELLILNSVPVDWSTVCVQIEPRYVEVVDQTVLPEGLKLTLRARPPSGIGDFATSVRLTAGLTAATRGLQTCSIAVPVQGSQALDVQVSPRVVFASWSRDQQKGSARFLILGRTADTPAAIESISCDGFQAEWKSSDVSHAKQGAYRTLEVDLDLLASAVASADQMKARSVHIALENGCSIDVPLYLVSHQERN